MDRLTWANREYTILRGASNALGTIIDGHLQDDQIKRLYEVWDANPGWPERLQFSGAMLAITSEMVLEVGEAAFVKAFGRKKTDMIMAEAIWNVAVTTSS